MSNESFEARLQRIATSQTHTATTRQNDLTSERPRRKPPGFLAKFFIAFLSIPFGIAARFLRQIYMDVTPEAVHFVELLAFVVASHLFLFVGGVFALLLWRLWPRFGWALMCCWAGYGVGTALLHLMGRV